MRYRINSFYREHMNPKMSDTPDGTVNSEPVKSVLEPGTKFKIPHFWVLRASLALAISAVSYAVWPFARSGVRSAILGVVITLGIVLVESRLRRTALKELIGGVSGMVLGLFVALLVTLVIARTAVPAADKSFFELISLLGFAYIGLAVGPYCGERWQTEPVIAAVAAKETAPKQQPVKLLDTSVLIDGRIAEICEAQFLDGVLAVPQFVLHELQLVTDSSDSLKRQRGRRGLEVLQRIKAMSQVEVRVVQEDFAHTSDVDHKLIELARSTGAKIITNDYNLNKVATVQGLSVLNVNQLANALKPAVLPGESMRVMILREGKEATQGVAYLNDGTMVVVDGARRLINKSIDIVVTSVHQTTAGKMIFGRVDERGEALPGLSRSATVGRVASFTSGPSYGSTRDEESTRAPEVRSMERNPATIFPQAGTE
jgi:uncharacterized protein YacL